jgi:hypothetical protein
VVRFHPAHVALQMADLGVGNTVIQEIIAADSCALNCEWQ